MSSTNRRNGGSNRPSHLTVAPEPDSARATAVAKRSAQTEEDAPLTTSGQVTITLTREEYMDLVEKPDEASTPTSGTANGFLDDTPARERAGAEEDAAFDHSTPIEPTATEPSVPDLDEEQRDTDTGPSCATTDADEERRFDRDPDPHFDELAGAGVSAELRGYDPPGSASIDTPPVRTARRSSPRPTPDQPQHGARRRFRRRSILLAPALAGLAIAVFAIVPARPSHTIAAGSDPAAALVRLPTFKQALAPSSAEIAALASRATSTGARHSVRQRSAGHAQHRTVTKGHSAPRVGPTALSTSPTNRSAGAAVAPDDPTSSAMGSTPARTVPTSSPDTTKSSAVTTGSSSPSPPAYGEGGVLGAGHSG